jgi:hypothetical protein
MLAAAALAALALAGPAGAATHRVSGKQIAIDRGAGLFRLDGSLVGVSKLIRSDSLAAMPLVQARSTDVFIGCLDRGRIGCDRRGSDRHAALTFNFTYEALFASPEPASLVWGSCRHVIVSATGGFAGARGVITMVQTPVRGNVRTDYIGNISLPSKRRLAHHRTRLHARTATAGGVCG